MNAHNCLISWKSDVAGFGRISYGLYLCHFPIFQQLGVLRRPGDLSAPFWRSAFAWGLSLGAALISYFLIERPLLAYKARYAALRRSSLHRPLLCRPRRRTVGSDCPRASNLSTRTGFQIPAGSRTPTEPRGA